MHHLANGLAVKFYSLTRIWMGSGTVCTRYWQLQK